MATLDLNQVPASAYPDLRLRNPAKKDHKWIKAVADGFLSEVWRGKNGMWYDGRDRQKIQLRYALAQQDTRQYLRTGDPEDVSALKSLVDMAPLPILPNKLRALEGLLTEREYDPVLTVLGTQAEQDIHKLLSEVQLWMEQGQALREMGIQPPAHLPDQIPQDAEELREWLETVELDAEIAMEEKMAVCLDESNSKLLGQLVRRDLIRHGHTFLHDSQLPGRRPVVKHLGVGNGLFLPTTKPDCSDWWAAAHVETLTLSDVRREVDAGVEAGCRALDTEDWRKVESAAGNTLHGMPEMRDASLGSRTDTGTLQVVRVFFLSDDEVVKQTKPTRAGNPKTYDKDPGFKNSNNTGKVSRATLSNVYEASLIVGTDVAYNCRLAVEQKRDPMNPAKGRLPYAAYVAGQVEGKAVSMVDDCIPIINDMERSLRMWRVDMKTYIPEGYNVDPDALASIPLVGSDGKKLNPIDAYKHFRRTGDSFGKRMSEDGTTALGSVVEKNNTGVPASAQQHWADFWNARQLLEEVTGANAVVSASTPKADVGKGVQEQALAGTQNILRYLFDAQESVHLAIFRNLVARIWATEHRNPVVGALPQSEGRGKMVKPFPTLHKYTFLTGIEPRPTPEEWQSLYQTMQAAWQAGMSGSADGLDVEDYIAIQRIPNLKRAGRELARRIKRRRKRMSEENAANSENNAKQQSASIQEKKAADMEVAQMMAQIKQGELAFARETQWGGIDRQIEGQRYVAELTNQTKAAMAQMQQQGEAAREQVQQDHEAQLTALEGQQQAAQTVLESDLEPEPTPAT